MISLIFKFVIIVVGIYIIFCIFNLKRNKGKFNKPHWTLLISLFFQVLLFVMFFSSQLEKFPESIVDIIWWGTVLFGFIFGVVNFKNNINLSTFTLILSFALSGLILLMIGITSM